MISMVTESVFAKELRTLNFRFDRGNCPAASRRKLCLKPATNKIRAAAASLWKHQNYKIKRSIRKDLRHCWTRDNDLVTTDIILAIFRPLFVTTPMVQSQPCLFVVRCLISIARQSKAQIYSRLALRQQL